MKYVVLRTWNGEEWVRRTIAVSSVEPLTEPTEAERTRAAHERALDDIDGSARRLSRRRHYGTIPSIEAWDAGCRTVVRGLGGEDGCLTSTSAETINNYLDAINLVDAT